MTMGEDCSIVEDHMPNSKTFGMATIIPALDSYLATYDRVYLISSDAVTDAQVESFLKTCKELNNGGRYMVLSAAPVGSDIVSDMASDCDAGCMASNCDASYTASDEIDKNAGDAGCVHYRHLTPQEEQTLIDLYHLYDFSDNFYLISSQRGYGGLLNFVKVDVLEMDDVWKAILQ